MKKVYFKQLSIENFLSVGEEPVVVDFKKGLHIITGINKDKEDRRNGIGKSTIVDAFYFAIFGNTLRNLSKKYIPNYTTNGVCRVTLTFTVDDPKHGQNEFLIERTLNPSACRIYKNNVDKTRDSIANTNEYIHTLLSSTPEIFQNCVIMTLNNHVPFMSKKKSDKRKFVEQIFNLEMFSKMMQELRQNYSEIKQSFEIEITRLEEKNKFLNSQTEQQKDFDERKNKRIKTIKEKIESNDRQILSKKQEYDELKDKDVKPFKDKAEQLNVLVEKHNSSIDEIKTVIAEHKHALQSLSEKYKKIGTEDDVCEMCLRSISDHDKQHIDQSKDEIRLQIKQHKQDCDTKQNEHDQLVKERQMVNNAIKTVETKVQDIQAQLTSLPHIAERITELEEYNKTLKGDIQKIQKEKESFGDTISTIQNEIDDIKTELDNIKMTINMLDVVKFVVSEEGVKSYIVRKILQHFNSKLAYYLKKLDSNCVCRFNEYFEEEIVSERGKQCMYDNFSGAERKAIDIGCLFSFIDMRKAQGDVYYNVNFYDELFDSSLDEKGVGLVLDILNERVEKYNECVFVISHRKESIKQATGEIVYLEKSNGITKRIDFTE
jgi:DNA repair exonuclease SbcCD ATPase subunit